MNYIIFDLESTCWENNGTRINEIIEIGAVKLNQKLKIIDEFNTFVKPTINKDLSEFCIKLTSIKQMDVDNANPFNTEIKNFEKWIVSNDENVLLCSWGYYDKKQILNESKAKKYYGKINNLLEKHISIKHIFAKIKKIKPCGMEKGLKILNLPLMGTHHRGIDDAQNITNIFKVIFNDLISLPEVSKLIQN